MNPTASSDERYVQRAMAAYWRSATRAGAYSPDMPANYSDVHEASNGKRYVVLRNINGILAVYRIRTDGNLKDLKRWPKELEKPS